MSPSRRALGLLAAWALNARLAAAPDEAAALSVLRAVEQRRSIARGTNTGISAFIDPRGRILS